MSVTLLVSFCLFPIVVCYAACPCPCILLASTCFLLSPAGTDQRDQCKAKSRKSVDVIPETTSSHIDTSKTTSEKDTTGKEVNPVIEPLAQQDGKEEKREKLITELQERIEQYGKASLMSTSTFACHWAFSHCSQKRTALPGLILRSYVSLHAERATDQKGFH